MKIFDGKTFRGWEADPSTWSIVEGAMHGRRRTFATGVHDR